MIRSCTYLYIRITQDVGFVTTTIDVADSTDIEYCIILAVI